MGKVIAALVAVLMVGAGVAGGLVWRAGPEADSVGRRAGGVLASDAPATERFEAGELLVVDPPAGFEAAVAELGFTVDQRIRLEALGFDVLRLRLSGDLGAAAAGRLLAARFPGLVFDTNYHYQTLRSGAAE